MTIKGGDEELKQNPEREDVQKSKNFRNEQKKPYLSLDEVFERKRKRWYGFL